MNGDDRELRELYRRGRGEGEEAPGFDELMTRSRGRRGIGGRRWAAVMAAAAAVLLAVGTFGTGEGEESGDEIESGGAVVMEVEMDREVMVEADKEEKWEELMEFADEVWAWEGETDFLLAEL